jgi:hypothetical protein
LLLVMKGAPEKIIERCSSILIVDEEVEVFYVKSALIFDFSRPLCLLRQMTEKSRCFFYS